MRYICLVCGVVLAAGLAAQADTVSFADGSTLNGKVSRPNENAIVVEFTGGQLMFQAADVVGIVENDLVDNPEGAVANPFSAAHDQEMQERTGLTAEQREEIRRLMAPLASPDPRTRETARKQLVAKAQEYDFWNYLAGAVPDMAMRYVPEVLRTLCEINPSKARELLIETSKHTCPVHRGSAIALLGMVGTKEDTPLVVRGLVDADPLVQISAANALGALRDPRATPALLAALGGTDQQVTNSCLAALSHIWSTDGAPVTFATAPEWQQFWEERAKTVADPVPTDSPAPLSEPLPEGVNPTYGY